jgi:hypothetical protein
VEAELVFAWEDPSPWTWNIVIGTVWNLF